MLKRSQSIKLFFHNLRFDCPFIIDYLFRQGWEHLESGESPRERTMDSLITTEGVFFSLTLYSKILTKKYVKITIQDSLKKIPLSVEQTAKAFHLKTLKGEIDYNKYRPIGYTMDANEQSYLNNDTAIIASALKQQFDAGLTKMTIASDAMNDYKKKFGEGARGKQNFEFYFPILSIETDEWIRSSYRGGFTYVAPRHAGVVFPKTTSYDVNSLFPSVMNFEMLPYGLPKPFDGEYEEDNIYPLYIQHIRAAFKIKPNHIPTIQGKGSSIWLGTEYITDTDFEVLDLFLTSVDLKLFFDQYDVQYIEYIKGLKFRQTDTLFKEYIAHWSHIKETSQGGERQLAKLMLNSLYGKFASRTETARKIPYLDKSTNQVKYESVEEPRRKPIYTAISSFITSYARSITVRAGQANYDRFIYADTDSIHLIGWEIPENLDIHDSDLGKWAHEGNKGRSKFLRPKTYIKEGLDGETLDITCAGLPKEARDNVSFENFVLGAVYAGKLSNTVVAGGSLLRESDFTIIDINKFRK